MGEMGYLMGEEEMENKRWEMREGLVRLCG